MILPDTGFWDDFIKWYESLKNVRLECSEWMIFPSILLVCSETIKYESSRLSLSSVIVLADMHFNWTILFVFEWDFVF